MADNQNKTGDPGPDIAPYDVLERDLNLAIGLQEAKVERLMGEIFANRAQAQNGMRKLMRARGLDYVIERLQTPDSLRNLGTFGGLRCDPLMFWRRHAVYAALRELPDGLRDLKQLCDRLADVKRARASLMRQNSTDAEEREPDLRVWHRTRGR